jgi:hypothetical protein
MLLEWSFASGQHLNQGLAWRLFMNGALSRGNTRENKRRADRQPESGVKHFVNSPGTLLAQA